MGPIVTVHSFNDAYAELAAVSITTLVRSTKRDCCIHIFENSVSEGAMAKILSIQGNHPNAKIAVHHIPDGTFAEVADERWAKETWYPLLAPEILGDLDRALVLEPDTLVCRDLSELFDMELGDSPLACHFTVATGPLQLATGKPLYFNAGVLLFNLRVLRESGAFGMERIIEAAHAIRLRYVDDSIWAAQESYLNYTFDHGALARFHPAYNLTLFRYMHAHQYATASTDELCEAVLNPAIIHFAGHIKPTAWLYTGSMVLLRKWWDCHALSPFADPKRDAERLAEIIEFRSNMENAIERLKRFQAEGTKIVLYGAGFMGTMFVRAARSMGLSPDRVCDLNRHGATIDGQPIEPPDALRNLSGGAIAVIAIAQPKALTEAKNTLLGFGFPESRILPVFEQLALGGRKWDEILSSASV
jgi:lipopolysaccharide biosynthesis glycosyltransferase